MLTFWELLSNFEYNFTTEGSKEMLNLINQGRSIRFPIRQEEMAAVKGFIAAKETSWTSRISIVN
jgi:hypothetical protein